VVARADLGEEVAAADVFLAADRLHTAI
jgi:hypothetical protein